MAILEKHGYFQAGANHCYGSLYLPAAEPCATGCLIIAPFGEEKKSSTRLLVLMARTLAERGIATLRFDFSATGESTGNHGQATLKLWQQEAETALQLLRNHCSTQSWLGIGARLGGNLLVRLATEYTPQHIILLEPLLNGELYLRDLQRRQQIKEIMSSPAETVADYVARWAAGKNADFGGYEIGAGMAAELQQLSLSRDLASLPTACQLSLLHVSGARDFSGAWQELALSLHNRANSSAEIVREKPFWGQLEYHEAKILLERVVDYAGSNNNT